MIQKGHPPSLSVSNRFFIKQKFEVGELFGFETRNRYQIFDEFQNPVAYAAEERAGFFDFLFRQMFGHWRKFNLHFFNNQGQLYMHARHPFRWFFQRIELFNQIDQPIGAIQRRFGIFKKCFDVEDPQGHVIYEVASPFFNFWTFTFRRKGRAAAQITKKWSGVMSEFFTDRDDFLLEYFEDMSENDRLLVLSASVYVDILFFERKAQS